MNDLSTPNSERFMQTLGRMSLKLIRISRLKQFIAEKGLVGPVLIGEAIGKKPNQTSDLLSGASAFGEKVARSIEVNTGLPDGWLDKLSDDPKIIEGYARLISEESPKRFLIDPSKYRLAWVVGRGSGGYLPETLWMDGDYPVGAEQDYAEVASGDPHAFLVEVMGPSMIPRYNPGEFALVEPGTEPDLEDDVLVRLATGQTMIKRLLSRRAGYRFGSFNDPEVLHYAANAVTWVYYVAHPVPARKIKSRS